MICLIAATPQETTLLRQQLPFTPSHDLPDVLSVCRFYGTDLALLHSGIGIASAAMQLTRLLSAHQPELLLAFGCGGSYPASKLNNGDLALALAEAFGDLGVEEESGFKPLAQLPLPVDEKGLPLFHQYLELPIGLTHKAGEILQNAAEFARVKIVRGTFVTVNRVSGTMPLCHALQERSKAICENMEGAALAQVAAQFGVPLLELRGISNPCGHRERALWDLPGGMRIAQQAVLRLLKELPRLRSGLCN